MRSRRLPTVFRGLSCIARGRMLLALTHEFLNAKVIAISGAGEAKNVLDVAKLLGARQTFQKPFSLPHLLSAVRYELEH